MTVEQVAERIHAIAAGLRQSGSLTVGMKADELDALADELEVGETPVDYTSGGGERV